MFRKLILHYKESIWFLPSLFIIGSILAAIFVNRIDLLLQQQFYGSFPAFLLTDVALARSIFGVIATSLLSMTAVTFSTIMIVFSIYSSQFSPRTLQNFISDRLTQIVLGIFIGGFTYSIVSLLLMRETKPDTFVFSAVFGIIFSLVCIGYFIRFIQHITVSIQVNNLVEEITAETLDTLKHKIKEVNEIKKNNHVIAGVIEGIVKTQKENPEEVLSYKGGHIRFYNIKGLINLAIENDVIIETTKRVGDYVTEFSPLFLIWNLENNEEDSNKDENIPEQEKEEKNGNHKESYEEKLENIKSALKKMVSIGNYRNTYQDLDFSLQKLEEIALRAISPGINDPNTAILCIRNLGDVLSKICINYFGKLFFYDKENNLKLILDDKDFEEILYSTFYKILNFSRTQISILACVLEAILMIAESKNKKINEILFEFTKYSLDGFDKSLLREHDIKFLNAKIKNIASYLDMDKQKISDLLLAKSKK